MGGGRERKTHYQEQCAHSVDLPTSLLFFLLTLPSKGPARLFRSGPGTWAAAIYGIQWDPGTKAGEGRTSHAGFFKPGVSEGSLQPTEDTQLQPKRGFHLHVSECATSTAKCLYPHSHKRSQGSDFA